MNRLIAVVIALVLSACSYDPYHYYYKCANTYETNGTQGTNDWPVVYVHNNVLKFRQYEAETLYHFVNEDDRFWHYSSKGKVVMKDGEAYSFSIEKGTNRIKNHITWYGYWDCAVEKTLFKK